MPSQPGSLSLPQFLPRALAGVALLCLLGACAAPAGGGAPQAAAQAPASSPGAQQPAAGDPALTANDWQLVQWSGGSLPQDNGGEPVVLHFAAQGGSGNAGGNVSGRAGCNRFNAAYALTVPGGIAFDRAASTRMACLPPLMQFESAYLASLLAVRAYQLSAGVLTLRDAAGNVQQYRAPGEEPQSAPARPATAPDAQVAELYVAPVRARCTGVAPMQCLQVRREPKGPWELWYAPIDGFHFKTGTAYRIRIVGTPVANPPADGSSISWKLDKILEQHRAGPRRARPAAEKK
ncbi:META and DUF4377 domain-containing protein [Herbaspirillum robiniae]|uniref:Heat-shock protein HslJ n=1 Tax=Herbaspirillum robiniae TaxID=2014887 RepID=A0A246WRS4_9BURK|nr:META and DUF4377 domain-containing protein [Herbaspirillum robiniae]OWY28343.1 hypothetical protein CEJ42_13940 [Herbaspirillum robiniae]